MMGQLLVRDLDDEVIARLKLRAARNGRSTEAEHRAILEAAVRASNTGAAEVARKLRKRLEGRNITNSTDVLRALRDERSTGPEHEA